MLATVRACLFGMVIGWWFLDFLDFFGFLGVDGGSGGIGVVEVVWGVVLSVGVGGLDVSEGADFSGGDDGGGLGGGGTKWWVCYRSPRLFGELWEDFRNSLPFFFNFAAMYFCQPEKEKWWMLFEVLTYECVEVWKSLRLDSYSNERLLYFSEMGVEARWGEGEWGDACGMGYFRSMGMVCCYLRISQNRNVVLLEKPKDAPDVVDGDRILDKNGLCYGMWEVDLCEAFRKISHCNQLNVCCESDQNVEMGMRNVTQTGVALLCENCVN